jgi:hypothetical protein
MTKKWRRIGDKLFNIQDDPGQKVDLSAAFPGVMNQLGESYEAWWKDVNKESDGYTRTIVGSEKQKLTMLTCQGWHGERVPYNQQHVKNAMVANGFWDLTLEKAGTYRVELRRWPRELNAAIDEAAIPFPLDPGLHDLNSKLYELPGNYPKVEHARLKFGEFDREVEVLPGQKMVQFEVNLEPGNVDLQSWFTDEDGRSRGAYFVYVELKSEL